MAVSIAPDCEILFRVFIKIWSIRVDVLQVALVGQFIN